jgi:hypothetical protein
MALQYRGEQSREPCSPRAASRLTTIVLDGKARMRDHVSNPRQRRWKAKAFGPFAGLFLFLGTAFGRASGPVDVLCPRFFMIPGR